MRENLDRHDERETGAVESVVMALHKVINLLDRIKTAIEESSNKIPRASKHLDTVTQATEMATVEILNVLDTMTQKISNAETELVKVRSALDGAGSEQAVMGIEAKLAEVKQDAMNITMALQVQDITAQKIAAANELIETVRLELIHELNYFEGTVKKTVAPHTPQALSAKDQRSRVFDPNASYRKSAEVQERVDKVVQEWREQQSTQDEQ